MDKNLYTSYSGVLELTPRDFNLKHITHNEFQDRPGLLIFYAPWCGHCQKMVKDISDLAIQFRYIFPIGTVNCENVANHTICQKFKIKSFPTILYQTPKNKLIKYTGERDKDSLLEFIYNNSL